GGETKAHQTVHEGLRERCEVGREPEPDAQSKKLLEQRREAGLIEGEPESRHHDLDHREATQDAAGCVLYTTLALVEGVDEGRQVRREEVGVHLTSASG